MKVFIDTGGFAALFYSKDAHHSDATALWKQLMRERRPLYTTNYVISETLTLLRSRSGHADSRRFGEAYYASSLAREVRITEMQERHAWEIFKTYDDHDFSFVDCSSFAVMKELGISTALTFDHHFKIMGFEQLSP